MTKGASNGDVTFTHFKPSQLRFDSSNPRFAGSGAPPSQQNIQSLLEKAPHLALELVPSLLENGFIDYEPIVVRKEASHYVVVEGNRRLAAIRHILENKKKYTEESDRLSDLQSIAALVFPRRPSAQRSQEQRVYLGVRHLFGFREWSPESKARYLDTHITNEQDVQRLMRELNIKRQDLQRYLVPYRLRTKAKALWAEHRDQDFWVLGEGLTRAGIKSYIELEVDRGSLRISSFERSKLKHLLRYVYGSPSANRKDRLIKDTRELSTLARLLTSRRAATALEKGKTLSDAAVTVQSKDESRRRLKKLVSECRIVVRRFGTIPETQDLNKSFKNFSSVATAFLRNGR